MAEINRRMTGDAYASDPAVGAVAITGSAQALSTYGRAILITTTGDISVTMIDGSSLTWSSIPVGIHALAVKAITSATAAGYVLL